MSKILERIGGCWNDMEPESIKPRDKIALYSQMKHFLAKFKKMTGIKKQIKISNNIIIVERSEFSQFSMKNF